MIRFSCDRFISYENLLGYRVKLGCGHNADIHEITQEIPANWQNRERCLQHLVIRMKGQEYTFGLGLTKTEHAWILQAIKHWLQ